MKIFSSRCLGAGFLVVMTLSPLMARVFLTPEQALKLAFPMSTKVDKEELQLSQSQMAQVEQMAKSKMKTALVTFYVGRSSKGVDGVAFFDTHIVRTMPETLMTVVGPDGHVKFVELLSFYEPNDYRPPKRWLGLFQDKELNDELWVKRGIRNVTGATLTTQAITETVRRAVSTYDLAVSTRLRGEK